MLQNYHNWESYETWVAKGWFLNDAKAKKVAAKFVQSLGLDPAVEAMADWIEDYLIGIDPILETDEPVYNAVCRDILIHALDKIDYRKIGRILCLDTI